jgi:predicted N-acyltransferase
MISIEQVGSLTHVDATEWNELAGENVVASYGWLRTLEETRRGNVSYRYILARTSAGLVGTVACKIEEDASNSSLNRMLFGRLAKAAQRLHLDAVPCLLCGTGVGAAEPVLVRAGATAEERMHVTATLVQAIEETAREKGWAVCFRQVRRVMSPIVEVLTSRGYLRGSELPTAYLELDPGWHSFADFRQHLKRSHPRTAKNIKGELNRAKRAGLVIEQLNEPAPYRERLHRLLDAHYVRLNREPFPFRAEFFDQLKARLGDRAAIYVARIGAELVGAQVELRGGEEVVLPMIGINHDSGRAGAAYVNLGYNRPIEDSIAAGRRRIYFGKLVYDGKARRGCCSVETDCYLRVWSEFQEHVLRALWPLRSWRNDSMSAALRRRKQERDHDVASREDTL